MDRGASYLLGKIAVGRITGGHNNQNPRWTQEPHKKQVYPYVLKAIFWSWLICSPVIVVGAWLISSPGWGYIFFLKKQYNSILYPYNQVNDELDCFSTRKKRYLLDCRIRIIYLIVGCRRYSVCPIQCVHPVVWSWSTGSTRPES